MVERLPGIKHYAGKTLVASGAKLTEMFALTVSDIGSADLMLYMGYDTAYYGVIGIAWTPVVCNPSQYNKYKVHNVIGDSKIDSYLFNHILLSPKSNI
jgi:hypothetical protein